MGQFFQFLNMPDGVLILGLKIDIQYVKFPAHPGGRPLRQLHHHAAVLTAGNGKIYVIKFGKNQSYSFLNFQFYF